ncbi:sec-independent protein translocase protein TatA [Pseudonocardia thermophila]|jgi:twin arginine-targeting protein translocase, TatA/E family|uniref:Sec-independent protein translocase protein TatA n=1 Tax=Pseudonocardia thermophila TaxID=1848 RepID=A0A1M6NCK8_PSETH|nr:Sec-independent protein translocase subunit TatA [Pseudonocardia thermophila]SHJ93334.1 sec-independent protein translocase protein TatA [Pseudonocardia thermophila]
MIPGGWELLVIVGVLLLLFGAKKLPEMARSIGQSARVFKGEMKGLKEDEAKAAATQNPPADEAKPLPPATQPQPPAQAAEPAPEQQTRSGQ